MDFLPYDGPIFDCVVVDGANVLTEASNRMKNEEGQFLLKKVEWKCSKCDKTWMQKKVPFCNIKDVEKFHECPNGCAKEQISFVVPKGRGKKFDMKAEDKKNAWRNDRFFIKQFTFSTKQLMRMVSQIESLGWNSIIIMKDATYNSAIRKGSNLNQEEINDLVNLAERGWFHIIPPGKSNDPEKDDYVCIREALERNGWIMTNDGFRKHLENTRKKGLEDLANDIESRLVKFKFLKDGELRFKLPKREKTLDETEITQTIEAESKILSNEENDLSVACIVHFNGLRLDIDIPLKKEFGRSDLIKLCPPLYGAEIINSVSRKHIMLWPRDEKIYIIDLNSTNGTRIDGMKINPSNATPISKNSIIRLGILEFSLNN